MVYRFEFKPNDEGNVQVLGIMKISGVIKEERKRQKLVYLNSPVFMPSGSSQAPPTLDAGRIRRTLVDTLI
jgi:hypothetical protein